MKLWLVLLASAAFAADSASVQFYSAIRQNDLPQLRKLVKQAGTDARDSRGNTPLMLAAGFGSVDAVRILLDAGADPTAVNGIGTTALMWGGHDLAKMQLLLAKGAEVNAKTRINRTALMVAAGSHDSFARVKFLLDKGADPNVVSQQGFLAATEAARRGDTETSKLLIAKIPPPMLKSPVGEQLMIFAAGSGNLELTRLLLSKGANPNATSPPFIGPRVKAGQIEIGSLTPLISAATYGDTELVRTLLEAGANPNARDARGLTPLMLALTTDRPNVNNVRLLLAKGADPKIKDKYGADARDWAARFQNKPVLDALGMEPVQTASVKLALASEKRSPGAAVEKAIALLQKSNTTFLQEGGCPACHSQNLTSLAIQTARAAGLSVDMEHERQQMSNTLNRLKEFEVVMPQGLNSPGAPDIEQYALLQLGAGTVEPGLVTDTVVMSLMRQQGDDGAWLRQSIPRPPVEDSRIQNTAFGMRCLQQFAPPSLKAEVKARIQKAAKWLEAQQPVSTDDRNMQILGLMWADHGNARSRVKELIALQREDGGWAQTPWLGSDAYATGQTLHVLHATGMRASDPVYQRGMQFLLSTQEPDGSWHVKSRSPKFQPYFQSGFPHDHDQWISSAGTAWAAMGLAHAVVPQPRAD